jgi:tetratricopeptide (TPR) repeat protein
LHLSEDVAEGLAVGRAVEGGSWQVETQPRPNDPKLYGTITDTHRRFVKQDGGHEVYVLQLDEKQNLGDYKGYSGSPVVLKSPTDAVIGVLIEQLRSRLSVPTSQPKPATNVLYAIPIQDVLDRFALLGVNQSSLTKYNLLHSLLSRHKLFGGREMELKQLNDFVSQHASGYMFITARSGFGKTALLANWVKTLLQNNQDGCYYFISRPDNLADIVSMMANLCQQLLAFHGRSDNLPTHFIEMLSLYRTLLGIPPPKGKWLIVVLDGLDEAVDIKWTPGPNLFPRSLPEGVFVVFSAREISDTDWLANLELSRDAVVTLQLKTLGTGEIAHLLGKAGGAAALQANNTKFVEALEKMSQGDPFYLHFLIEDVIHKDITEENIDQQPIGLNGYLEKWWKELNDDVDINRQEAYDLLGSLIIAKGPLLAGELAGISPVLRRGALLNKELGGKLRRYLVGDPQEGYALCHPRFGDYLQTKFFPEELQNYREELLSYCSRWREHKSKYALSFYPVHLFELGHVSDLYALIDKAWMDAQFERTYSHRAFSADVELAIAAAQKETTRNAVLMIVRNSLVYATLGSLTTNVPPEALEVLVQVGQHERALGYADLIQIAYRRGKALCQIGRALVRKNQTDEANIVLERAISTAEAIDAWSREEESGGLVLAEVAQTLVQVGMANDVVNIAERAIALALNSPSDVRQDHVLRQVASVLVSAGLIDQALKAIEKINDTWSKAVSLSEVIKTLVQSGQTDRAVALCDAIDTPWYRVLQLVGLVEVLVQVGEEDRAGQAANQAVLAAQTSGNQWYKPHLLAQAARALVQGRKPDQALEVANEAITLARGISNVTERSWSLAGVARGLAQAGLMMQIAEGLSSTEFDASSQMAQGWAFIEIAKSLAREGHSLPALYEAQRSEALLRAGGRGGGNPLEYAFPELDYIKDSWPKSPLTQVIMVIAEAGQVDLALRAVPNIKSSRERESVQAEIVKLLINADQWDQAIAVAEKISSTTTRSQMLAEIARALIGKDRDTWAIRVADQAIAEAQIVSNPWSASWALVEVVKALVKAEHIDRAEAITERISDPEVRVWALVEIVNAFAQDKENQRLSEVVDRVMEAAEQATEQSELRREDSNHLRSRMVLVPEGDLKVSLLKSRNSIGPGARRALETGLLIGFLHGEVLADVKAYILPTIVEVLTQANQDEKAVHIIDGVVAAKISSKSQGRDWALAQAVGALSRLGQPERALTVAETISDPWLAAPAFASVVVALSRIGRVEQASVIADRAVAKVQSLNGPPGMVRSIQAEVAISLAQAGQIGQMLTKVEDLNVLISSLLSQKALARIVEALVRIGDSDRATVIANHTKIITYDNVDSLVEVIKVLIQAGQRDSAAEFGDKLAAKVVADLQQPQVISTQPIEVLAQLGKAELVTGIASKAATEAVGDPLELAPRQHDLTRTLAEIGEVEHALTVAESIVPVEFKASALRWICLALLQLSQKEHAMVVASHIEEVAEVIENPATRARSLIKAAWALAYVEEGERAASSLIAAVSSVRFVGRSSFFEMVQESIPLLYSIDEGQTLWHIHEALLEVDKWWSASP